MESDQKVDTQRAELEAARSRCNMCQHEPPSYKFAFALGIAACEEDKNRNYEDALELYEDCIAFLNHAIEHDVETDFFKTCFRYRHKQFSDRAKKLRLYFNERRRIEKLRELQYEYPN